MGRREGLRLRLEGGLKRKPEGGLQMAGMNFQTRSSHRPGESFAGGKVHTVLQVRRQPDFLAQGAQIGEL